MGLSPRGAVVVVTGGASGIGLALAERFAAEGARAVAVLDLDAAEARRAAAGLPGGIGLGLGVDVTDEAALRAAVARVEAEAGPVDVWCGNAGLATGPGLGSDEDWARGWAVHVLAHLYAARAVLPGMVARGRGHFLVTASAAGLLTELDSAAYPVTKHAGVALAEWLAIHYGGNGVSFSCLCPQGVRTPLLAAAGPEAATLHAGPVIEPDAVAREVLASMARERFLVLPHPEVAEYERQRAGDRDRWLAGMRRMWGRIIAARATGGTNTSEHGAPGGARAGEAADD
jgi:NAD(P)-dependent dehydrogenase (short-subunit alcohol dehydrogenase family)